jgi:hypothetical protein
MKRLSTFICMLFAGAAALPSMAWARDQAVPIARVEVRHYVPLTMACPEVGKQLAQDLYPAWRAIDSAADVLVDFKLEGTKVSDVKLSGGHGDYIGPVRHAVKAMKCRQPGAGAYAVRFRIKFQYPEDQPSALAAIQFADEAPELAAR